MAIKKVRFKWDDGRVTFLWPDYPLIIAGSEPLDLVIRQIEDGIDIEIILRNMADKYKTEVAEVRDYVVGIFEAIEATGVLRDENKQFNSISSFAANSGLAMATLNLTKKCNLSCSHCYAQNKTSVFGSEMSSYEIRKAITELGRIIKNSPKLLVISGGEPTLEKDKLKLAISAALDAGLSPRVNTNGYFIDNELAMFLSSHKVLTQVSLDGADSKTNAILRKDAGAFDIAIMAIKNLINAGCCVRISCTFHKGNIRQIPEIIELARSLGADQFITSNLVGVGNALHSNLEMVEFSEEFRILYDAVKSSYENQIMTRATLFAETINAIRAGIRFTYCGTGCCTCCVDADGSVYPCINMVRKDFCVGNIKNVNLESVWENSYILKGLRNLNVDTMNSTCPHCIFRYFCGGYCRGETLEKGLQINDPYSRCRSWKKGLIKILDFISETPDIYNLNPDPYIGVLHRE